jgi:diguanylate cyclase (GGDEF)-like protein
MEGLDGFKAVNDTLGHETGDLVLRETARRLKGVVRFSDTVARMGGDVFVVFLSDVEGVEGATRVATKIIESIRSPFVLRGRVPKVTTSVGIALFPHHGGALEPLLKAADEALYLAKREGRNRFQVAAGPAPDAETPLELLPGTAVG